MSYITQGR